MDIIDRRISFNIYIYIYSNFRTPSYNPRSISPGLYITEGGTEKHNSTITYVPNDDNHKRSKSNPKGTSHHRSPGKPTNLSFTVGNNERTKEQERVRYITSPGSGNIMLLERDMIQVGGGKAKNLDETIIKANKDNEKISDREIQKSTNKDTSEPEQIGNKSTVYIYIYILGTRRTQGTRCYYVT